MDTPLQFSDATEQLGTSGIHGTWSISWADFNKDGWVDSLLNNHNDEPPSLLLNAGDSFQDVAAAAGIAIINDHHSCRWADADDDGFLDVYCAAGAVQGNGSRPANLWRNNGNETFTDIAEASGVTIGSGRGRSVHWLDIDADGDGDLDLGTDSVNS